MSFGGTTRANLGELVYKQETTPHLVDAILLWLGRLGSMLFFLLLVITVILNQGLKNIPTLQEKTSEVSGAVAAALRILYSPADSSPWPSSLLGEPAQALKGQGEEMVKKIPVSGSFTSPTQRPCKE